MLFAVTLEKRSLAVTLLARGRVFRRDLGPVAADSLARLRQMEALLDDKVERFLSGDSHAAIKQSDPQLAKLLSDRSSRVFRGDEHAVRIWDGVIAAPTLHEGIAEIGRKRIGPEQLAFLNLVDDEDTREYQEGKGLERYTVNVDGLTRESLERHLRGISGKILLMLAHLENGEVVVRQEQIPARELEDVVQHRGNVLILIGCGSALAGTGFQRNIHSLEAIDRIASAVKRPTVQGILSALGEPSNPIQIDEKFVKGIGALSEETVFVSDPKPAEGRPSLERGPMMSIRTSGDRVVAIRIELDQYTRSRLSDRGTGGVSDGGGHLAAGALGSGAVAPDAGESMPAASTGVSSGPQESGRSRLGWLLAGAAVAALGAGVYIRLRPRDPPREKHDANR